MSKIQSQLHTQSILKSKKKYKLHSKPQNKEKFPKTLAQLQIKQQKSKRENLLLETILHWEGTEIGEEIETIPRRNPKQPTA